MQDELHFFVRIKKHIFSRNFYWAILYVFTCLRLFVDQVLVIVRAVPIIQIMFFRD